MQDLSFRDRPFTLRQLQYALAVHHTGAFGKAADLCGVSQPSLSAQVAKLESLLDVQLFERLPRKVTLTGEGELLLPTMRRIVALSEELESRARAAAQPGAVLLRVGVIPTVAPYLLPAASAILASQLPHTRVHWVEERTPDLERSLASGDLDAAIIADAPALPGMQDVELRRDPFSLLVPATDPMEGPLDPAVLQSLDVLLLEDGHCLRDHALDLCGNPSLAASPFRATSLPTLVQMVGAGLGVTILPDCATEVEASRAPVRVVPFASPSPARVLRLVYRTASSRAGALDQLARTLAEGLATS